MLFIVLFLPSSNACMAASSACDAPHKHSENLSDSFQPSTAKEALQSNTADYIFHPVRTNKTEQHEIKRNELYKLLSFTYNTLHTSTLRTTLALRHLPLHKDLPRDYYVFALMRQLC